MTSKCALITTKFGVRQYDGERFSRGSMTWIFPSALLISEDKDGNKTCQSQIMAPYKIKNYPEMA